MDKSKALLALLALNLLVVSYFGYSHRAADRRHAERMEAEFRSLQQQVQMLEGQIRNGVRSELIAQADKVEQLDYTITEADLVEKRGTVDLRLTLREVSSDAVIAVSLAGEDPAQSTRDLPELELEHQGGMQYGAKLELPLEQNYVLSVWEKSGAGQKQLNATQLRLALLDDVYRNRVANSSGGTSHNQERLEAHYTFTLRDLGVPGIGLDRAMLRIRLNGDVYDEIDVTAQAISRPRGYGEVEDHYKLAIASGQIDSSVTLEQFARDQGHELPPSVPVDRAGEQTGDLEYTLKHTIVYAEDYPALELDDESADQLSFEWVLRFKDGYEHLH